ncbi:uncharacterized protein TM35_000481560 [Trypanosoma theileri]|uniref:Uncharacterized protein n=1 Tax=Trypanosoma theileri TaxID=67003 RepID=A0A1X0NHI5_9TRYP|nr:uncharacterized protein TM35_000481560 [Trypanosoma theileri]ORC84195.1 hypothetical protein TM35_000481560 [Trypanosoma theileri]
MLPWILITNAVVFAIVLLITVAPPLYIYDPRQHPGESLGPPTAGGIFPDSAVSHSVRQKLYILFVLPFAAIANSLFLYFSYYRHVRYVQFRVELHHVAQVNLMVASNLLDNDIMNTREPSTYNATGSMRGIPMVSNRSLFVRNSVVNRRHAVQRSEEKCHQHARPAVLSLHSYSSSPWWPELKELQEVVDTCFLRHSESARLKTLEALHKNVLVAFEKENNLRNGSIRDALLTLIERSTTFLSESMIRAYLTREVVKETHKGNQMNGDALLVSPIF